MIADDLRPRGAARRTYQPIPEARGLPLIGVGLRPHEAPTAESYEPYISEELLGKALGTRRKEIVLDTKVGFKYDGNRLVNQCSSFDHVVTAAEGCLLSLRHPSGPTAV